MPVPDSNPERIGLAVGAGGEVVDPPLSETRRRFDPVGGIGHPSGGEGGSDFMDAIEEAFQQLSGVSQVYCLPYAYSYKTCAIPDSQLENRNSAIN